MHRLWNNTSADVAVSIVLPVVQTTQLKYIYFHLQDHLVLSCVFSSQLKILNYKLCALKHQHAFHLLSKALSSLDALSMLARCLA